MTARRCSVAARQWRPLTLALGVALLAACGDVKAPPVRVVIPKGASFRAATDSLSAKGLVRFPPLFRVYARLRGRDRSLRYGTYLLSPGSSWNELLEDLRRGRGLVHQLTIPEGWNLLDIVPALAQALEVPEDSVQAAVRDPVLRQRLDIPTPTLEGYLFPDTYDFADGTTAREAVARMVARFEAVWQPDWTERARAMALTRHDIVTLASIVEKEVRRREEGPIVAAVYLNRLRTRMPLQADPTVQYARGVRPGRVLFSHLKVESPYNTYKYPGLPPGPIASPGAASLEASVKPADVPYRFFVAHPDGHHECRRTYKEHLQAIAEGRAAARAAAAADSAAADSAAARPDSGSAPATAPAQSR